MSVERYRLAEVALFYATKHWRMVALTAALIIAGCVALAEAVNNEDVDIDLFLLMPIDKHTSELTYYNSAAMNSFSAPRTMEGHGFTIALDLDITAGDEILTVTPSEGWVAIPERISVADGDEGTITIIEILGF